MANFILSGYHLGKLEKAVDIQLAEVLVYIIAAKIYRIQYSNFYSNLTTTI